MYDVSLLMKANSRIQKRRPILQDGHFIFVSDEPFFDEYALAEFMAFCNRIVHGGYPKGIPVIVQFTKEIKFEEKLMFILLECVCKYLISEGHPVSLNMKIHPEINTHGFESSPLKLLESSTYGNTDRFKEKFSKDLFRRHYRGVFPHDAKGDDLSIIMGDTASFQRIGNIRDEDRDMVAEVMAELLGNAQEHSMSDCLYDFDITPAYRKKGSDKIFVGMNIVILNLSHKLLGTGLKQKLEGLSEGLPARYKQVMEALERHKIFFNSLYREEDFFNIAAFQHKISGRVDNNCTGGTGLTKLIHTLEEKSDAYDCFVQSGSRQFRFEHRYMNYNEDWIGFNDSNDFLTRPPNIGLFRDSRIYLPGTAYNLTFIMETEGPLM
jgi:hypothetical protein